MTTTPRPDAGPFIRCMGPWPACKHTEGNCTASRYYQASLATPDAASQAAVDDRLRPVSDMHVHEPPAALDVGEGACFDAGLLGDGGGGDVDWWQDYIRALLADAHEFYTALSPAALPQGEAVLDAAADYLRKQYGASYGLDHPVDRARILAALRTSEGE